MRTVLAAFAAAALAAGAAGCSNFGASDLTPEQEAVVDAVMAPIRQFAGSFNVGDFNRAFAACSDNLVIVHEHPPYSWGGPGAAQAWMNAFVAHAVAKKISSGVVTLGEPRQMEISGDRAYVVLPADYDYKQDGVAMEKRDCTVTVALVLTPTGWLITGWAWAKN